MFGGGRHERIYVLELACQGLGRYLAHKPYTKGKEHPFKRYIHASCHAIRHLLVMGDTVEVGHIMEHAITIVLLYQFGTYKIDIHCLA